MIEPGWSRGRSFRVGWACVLLALGCGDEREPGGPAAVAREGEVAVVVAERGPVFEWSSGAVASAHHTVVASRVLATIEEVRVRAGADVAVDDVLVVLDARDLAARTEEAEQAHAAALEEQALAEREAERQAHLLAEGVGTLQESDRATSKLRVARAETARTEQAVEAARVARSHAEIRSPVKGRVVDRLAEPGDTATPGKPLLRIYDPSVLRVEAPVRESLAVKLHLGEMLLVEVESLALRVEGAVDEIVPFAEAGARTLLVKVRLPADSRLYAGLFARVAIPAGERTRILVPETAVMREGQLEQVFMADASGAAELRAITTGERLADGRVEVLSGLREGERIRIVSRAPAGADTPAASPQEEAAWRERGAEASGRLKTTLMQALSTALAEGPPEAEIEVCRTRAPELARQAGAPGIRVGRTSHKLRNPANAPPDWVEPWLARYVAGEKAGEATVVPLGGGRGGYLEPIATAPLCLTCHGEAIAPAVAEKLRALYPEDQAIGFRAGDFRGLVWVELETPTTP
ncbi:MAG: efflux RND transporter periplasmic adaptor subunit [Deltaproteobacteria bacterium]|nr:efflux RND transporter periplasmic adaptor subunit [Deltaproteobacteria bacterium]